MRSASSSFDPLSCALRRPTSKVMRPESRLSPCVTRGSPPPPTASAFGSKQWTKWTLERRTMSIRASYEKRREEKAVRMCHKNNERTGKYNTIIKEQSEQQLQDFRTSGLQDALFQIKSVTHKTSLQSKVWVIRERRKNIFMLTNWKHCVYESLL